MMHRMFSQYPYVCYLAIIIPISQNGHRVDDTDEVGLPGMVSLQFVH